MHEGKDKKIAFFLFFGLAFSFFFVMITLPCEINENEPITVIIKKGMGISEIAEILKEKELINSKTLFLIVSFLSGKRLIAGEYEFNKNMSIMDIIGKMKRGERKIYVVRIIEGSNLFDVSRMLEQNLGIGREHFLNLARDKEFMKTLNISSGSLEGYLAPETYYYSKEIEFHELVEKIVSRTFRYFENENVRQRMAELGLDIHRTLTLASLIEKEAKREEEKPLISAVFHNRLRIGMPLECDPTVLYGTEKSRPITKEDLRRKTDYNTYTFKGLPPGPICNPSVGSIRAALYPAPVDYLYFVSKNDGSHVFSTNLREHARYVRLYQRKNNNHIN